MPRPLGHPGANGPVHASTTWDPDGTGPGRELLVVGGEFTGVGETVARHIAAWDGSSWQALGSGVTGPADDWPWAVLALQAYNGELIAGGSFAQIDGVAVGSIARWNGSEWLPLGGYVEGTVLALTVFNGELIAGGEFLSINDVPANGIARWTGSVWQPLGPGLVDENDLVRVHALAVYNGELIAAGVFTSAGGVPVQSIARWDGGQWRPLGDGGPEYIFRSLAVYNGELIASASDRTAAWDGAAWRPIGSVESAPLILAVYGGELITGGAYSPSSDDVISRWDGTVWRSLGAGVSGGGFIRTMTVYGGELIVGGEFDNAGGVPAANLARWNGTRWRRAAPGTSGEIHAFLEHEGELIAAGTFTGAGETLARDVASWDGLEWRPMGTGVAHTTHDPSVRALAEYGGEVIAAGVFTTAGEESAGCVARWDGAAWRPLGSGVSGGQPALIRALTVHGGELVAGGTFATAGGGPAGNIARWDGAAWHPLGSGLAGCGTQTTVYAMASYAGELIVSGCFNQAGGVPALGMARWNGSAWSSLGAGPDGDVYCLTVYGGELIACGSFTSIAGVPASDIARWDGSQWRPLGPGPGLSFVDTMAVVGGKLYVNGGWGGGAHSSSIMRWDGQAWDTVDSTEPFVVGAIAPFRSELVAWSIAFIDGERSLTRIGRWSESGLPWIAREPAAQAAPAGGAAAFAVVPAMGYDNLGFQWRRDGVPVADGPGGASGGGGTVAGAASPTLTITGVRHSDAGLYTCEVLNACGGILSADASLIVQGAACPVDWDHSGSVNSLDISAFLASWLASLIDGSTAADFSADGLVNSADLSAYLAAWLLALSPGSC